MRNQLDLWRGDRTFNSLQRAMNRLLEDFWTPFDNSLTSDVNLAPLYDFAPSWDLEEADDHYVYCFDVPGVNKDDIKIEVANGLLTVSGERKEEHKERERG